MTIERIAAIVFIVEVAAIVIIAALVWMDGEEN